MSIKQQINLNSWWIGNKVRMISPKKIVNKSRTLKPAKNNKSNKIRMDYNKINNKLRHNKQMLQIINNNKSKERSFSNMRRHLNDIFCLIFIRCLHIFRINHYF